MSQDDEIEEIDPGPIEFMPIAIQQSRFREILAPISEFLMILVETKRACEFKEYLVPGGVGCSARLDNDVLVVALCGGVIDGDGRAEIRVGEMPRPG